MDVAEIAEIKLIESCLVSHVRGGSREKSDHGSTKAYGHGHMEVAFSVGFYKHDLVDTAQLSICMV